MAVSGAEIYVDLTGLIDVGAEITRNEKEREKLAAWIQAKEAKLANANFVERHRPTWSRRSVNRWSRPASGWPRSKRRWSS